MTPSRGLLSPSGAGNRPGWVPALARGFICALLAWWYLAMGVGGREAAIGPFRSQSECEQISEWAMRARPDNRTHSWCWWDGKSWS